MNWNDGSEDYNQIHRLREQVREKDEEIATLLQHLQNQGRLLDDMWKSRDRWKRRAQLFKAALAHERLRREAAEQTIKDIDNLQRADSREKP